MRCHECARDHRDEAAVAHGRFCLIGLCKLHLVASFRSATVPQHGCDHHPERPFPESAVGFRPLQAVGR